jgi:hypothetical protein
MAGPAEVFPLAEYLSDEMIERGWTSADVAMRMANGREYGINILCVELLLAIDDEDLKIDDETFSGLAAAFGVSEAMFRSLDANWRRWPDRRSRFEAPEHLFAGGEFPKHH